MSPFMRSARRKERRLTLIGIVLEISYVAGLSVLFLAVCALAFALARF
jgi:hypothetical protein